ncbi:MAG: ABC transporter ATP-binding protein [Candidatus Methanospirareceae archaeon]
MLAVHEVAKSFGGIKAVDGCSLKIKKNAIVGLIGPNGAGKTTLLKIISGFEKPDNGRVIFNGEDIEGMTSFEIARKGLIRTFQISKPLTKLTVEENMLLAPQFQHGERIWNVWLRPKEVKRQEEENREKAHALLEFFDLISLKDEYAGALSGGQKRLLEIARALMADPKMLLLDEPFAGVNPTLAMKILERIKELRDTNGMTILAIEHNMPMIMQLSDYIYVLNKGKVIASGAPEEVRANEQVVDAYLGGV